MPIGTSSKKFAGVFSALALCVSSTGAIAAGPSPQARVSPFVALSALGSGVSAAALCGSSASVQGAGQGCVLPAADPAMPAAAVQTEGAPMVVDQGVPVGGGVSPLLLALVGVAAAVALYYLVFRGNDNFHIVFPPFPQSPA
jgi:hypothetical protein